MARQVTEESRKSHEISGARFANILPRRIKSFLERFLLLVSGVRLAASRAYAEKEFSTGCALTGWLAAQLMKTTPLGARVV